jgi:hypothetical protein
VSFWSTIGKSLLLVPDFCTAGARPDSAKD